MRQRLWRIAKGAAGLVIGLAALGAVAYGLLFAAGYRPVVVYSGSMEPEVGVGALAFVERVPSERIGTGDVITFTDPYNPARLVTHRVVETLERPEGGLAYRTKGDANASRDPWTIALPGDAGRLALDVPYAGYALWYAKTREARTAVIVLVSALVLVLLLRAIWRREDEDEAPARAAPAADADAFWLEALTR